MTAETPGAVEVEYEDAEGLTIVAGRPDYDTILDSRAAPDRPEATDPDAWGSAGEEPYRSETEPQRVAAPGRSGRSATDAPVTLEAAGSPYHSVVGYASPVTTPSQPAGQPYATVTASPAAAAPSVLDELLSWPWGEALSMVPQMSLKTRAERQQIVTGVFERAGAAPPVAREMAGRYLDAAASVGESLAELVPDVADGFRRLRLPRRHGGAGERAIDGPATGIMPATGNRLPAGWVTDPPVVDYGTRAIERARERAEERAKRGASAKEKSKRGSSARRKSKRKIERHEVLQAAWLRIHGYATSRSQGHGPHNPSLELPEAQHKAINKMQRAEGLYRPDVLRELSAIEVIDRNLDILRRAGVSHWTRKKIEMQVMEMLPGLGADAYPKR